MTKANTPATSADDISASANGEFSLNTKLSESEILDKVKHKIVIDEWLPWWVFLVDSDTFRGQVNYIGLFEFLAYRKEVGDLRNEGAIRGNQFYVFRSSKEHKYRNCICPFLYGTIEQTDSSRIIKLKMRLNPFMRVALMMLMVPGLVLGAISAILAMAPGSALFKGPLDLILTSLFCGAFIVGFPYFIIALDRTFTEDKEQLCKLIRQLFPQ